VNEVPFRVKPHHNVHSTLGVDTGATGPRWRVDSMGGGRRGKRVEGERGEEKIPVTRDFLCCSL
jgi:hypothetical protein